QRKYPLTVSLLGVATSRGRGVALVFGRVDDDLAGLLVDVVRVDGREEPLGLGEALLALAALGRGLRGRRGGSFGGRARRGLLSGALERGVSDLFGDRGRQQQ